MNNILTLTFFFYFLFSFGQSHPEVYKFSKTVVSQVDKDTLAWKYQLGAAELSFGGHYRDVVEMWDKNGVKKPQTTVQDSLFFVQNHKIQAKDYIIEQAKNKQIVIINEAHHVALHRLFTTSLLQGLYDNGYRHLGLEALFSYASLKSVANSFLATTLVEYAQFSFCAPTVFYSFK